ncbi:hypothetical protein WR25_10744 [Diploscapter pachys]|uniref:Ig-like domain-containing protein n=1 Tax=Diploscapter pachys TaxID=2018661 RepID=A0A2A2JBE5_9BILA|nr:hypothetical protein WR25_10744 [Diploscapter pachys]
MINSSTFSNKWAVLIIGLGFAQQIFAQSLAPNSTACGLNSTNGTYLVRAKYNDSAVLQCDCFGMHKPRIKWFLYEILSGGFLHIKQANSTVVERYVCTVEKGEMQNHTIINFRLDYTDWYSKYVFHSVFWGALLTSLIVCIVTFVVNIIWILTRESILWAERLSRVRKMVEALEKYRTRQMERIHENYQKKIQIVRDNYHQQIETIRVSYTAQSERFRDYRTAQMESMHSHLDSIRDNYYLQLQRVREHGSKRAEQLWESYEKQVNRMRAFSAQQRLKLMRQYKVKQRYLNKLLENFQDANNPEALRQHEEDVRVFK